MPASTGRRCDFAVTEVTKIQKPVSITLNRFSGNISGYFCYQSIGNKAPVVKVSLKRRSTMIKHR